MEHGTCAEFQEAAKKEYKSSTGSPEVWDGLGIGIW